MYIDVLIEHLAIPVVLDLPRLWFQVLLKYLAYAERYRDFHYGKATVDLVQHLVAMPKEHITVVFW